MRGVNVISGAALTDLCEIRDTSYALIPGVVVLFSLCAFSPWAHFAVFFLPSRAFFVVPAGSARGGSCGAVDIT